MCTAFYSKYHMLFKVYKRLKYNWHLCTLDSVCFGGIALRCCSMVYDIVHQWYNWLTYKNIVIYTNLWPNYRTAFKKVLFCIYNRQCSILNILRFGVCPCYHHYWRGNRGQLHYSVFMTHFTRHWQTGTILCHHSQKSSTDAIIKSVVVL